MSCETAVSLKGWHTAHATEIVTGRYRCCCIVRGCFHNLSAKYPDEMQRHFKKCHPEESAKLVRFPYELMACRTRTECDQMRNGNANLSDAMGGLNLQSQIPQSSASLHPTAVTNTPSSSRLGTEKFSHSLHTGAPMQADQFAISFSTTVQTTTTTTTSTMSSFDVPFRQAQQANSLTSLDQQLSSFTSLDQQAMSRNGHAGGSQDNHARAMSEALQKLAGVIPNNIGNGQMVHDPADQLDVVETATSWIEDIENANEEKEKDCKLTHAKLCTAQVELRRAQAELVNMRIIGQHAEQLFLAGGAVSIFPLPFCSLPPPTFNLIHPPAQPTYTNLTFLFDRPAELWHAPCSSRMRVTPRKH